MDARRRQRYLHVPCWSTVIGDDPILQRKWCPTGKQQQKLSGQEFAAKAWWDNSKQPQQDHNRNRHSHNHDNDTNDGPIQNAYRPTTPNAFWSSLVGKCFFVGTVPYIISKEWATLLALKGTDPLFCRVRPWFSHDIGAGGHSWSLDWTCWLFSKDCVRKVTQNGSADGLLKSFQR